jgi:hypothetical protein
MLCSGGAVGDSCQEENCTEDALKAPLSPFRRKEKNITMERGRGRGSLADEGNPVVCQTRRRGVGGRRPTIRLCESVRLCEPLTLSAGRENHGRVAKIHEHLRDTVITVDLLKIASEA